MLKVFEVAMDKPKESSMDRHLSEFIGQHSICELKSFINKTSLTAFEYKVAIKPDDKEGVFASNELLSLGSIVRAQFVCIRDHMPFFRAAQVLSETDQELDTLDATTLAYAKYRCLKDVPDSVMLDEAQFSFFAGEWNIATLIIRAISTYTTLLLCVTSNSSESIMLVLNGRIIGSIFQHSLAPNTVADDALKLTEHLLATSEGNANCKFLSTTFAMPLSSLLIDAKPNATNQPNSNSLIEAMASFKSRGDTGTILGALGDDTEIFQMLYLNGSAVGMFYVPSKVFIESSSFGLSLNTQVSRIFGEYVLPPQEEFEKMFFDLQT
jgi:hypothetical protein